ncbi:accessory Sec system translocase SecA2 [Niallia endozanthoxylica]|uniref:Protein translocase subunit SecA n=1 Tax=Niallia endozanthoxylica TaxID=2036016 RepID=A0A5J5H727_9BACI|nr:accessory Sec system translocase SecA2 [Niallia endozanthoxylica]KAA9015522.1 accessory Sec system translocase SecA2 [Niallia endozanthoxylica]
MLGYFKKLTGDKQTKKLNIYYNKVKQINALEPEIEKLTDEQLKAKTSYFKEQLENGKSVLDIQVEAFAVVREAAKRVVGMRHFDVQLIGGMVLSEGNIAEMPTGEGKTLVASLSSYLRALEGKGVHVITVNDYLATRDRELIGGIYEFLGLTVGLNLPMMDPNEKKAAYQADITYGVGTEFGFDHLRDHMAYDPNQRVQRPYHYAIIDEADSVLVDEAKTPLIIAGKTGVSNELSYLCARVIKTFKQDEDFVFDPETKATNFTDEGIAKIERGFDIENLYDLEHQTLYHYVIQALRAHIMFKRDVDYIVKEGKVLLVDAFTGRTMEGRSLSNGLHQAIEAKEGLELTEENKTQASITIQNYFRLYPTLSGMTGTAKTEEKEFQEIYSMNVIQIPTNRPIMRKDLPDQVFDTIENKYKAVARRVRELHDKGQPVLIGTTSILQSEEIADYLRKENLQFEVLNAKTVEQEVQLISLAGQKGRITVATNMAGRGTDIMLGEGVAELGGLYVVGTERNESRRIDNQLKGRSGRQGDPGTSEFFLSLEDDLIRRFASEEVEKLKKKLKVDSDGRVLNDKMVEFFDRTQRICEGSGYSIREYNIKLDDVLNLQRGTVYELRTRILEGRELVPLIKTSVESYVKNEVEYVTSEEIIPENWDLSLLVTHLSSVMPGTDLSVITDMMDRNKINDTVLEQLEGYFARLDAITENPQVLSAFPRYILSAVDHHWLAHLEAMERLKEGIGLRSYSQEDPMRQYGREGYALFTEMYHKIEKEIGIQTAAIVRSIESQIGRE